MTEPDEHIEPDEQSADSDHHPARDKPAFACPHCGVVAQQKWAELVGRSAMGGPGGPVESGTTAGGHFLNLWKSSHCAVCQRPALWRAEVMVYPSASLGDRPHPDMPPEVRELYVEAASVAAVSLRAGAALARATVEKLIKQLDSGASSKDGLDIRIARLHDRVSPDLAQILNVVRFTGNKVLHGEDQPSELVVMALDDHTGPAVIGALLAAANDLVDELISRPKERKALFDKLSDGVKQDIAQKQARAQEEQS
ncbi:hypothetical protein FB384_004205 [Prauserella sediminis]|uniref:DUF4145 domain-containing protein n=1 Tax=Prauserella sediminis TaxID=577680 RepID=A0A839XN15_9PSEU|nr:DUF4145 domain-containing protein [Prauserella sediminis]MBB3665252.1 hypothetical protein [Prauserella sediminis]